LKCFCSKVLGVAQNWLPRMHWQMMDKLKSAWRILICPVDKYSVNGDNYLL